MNNLSRLLRRCTILSAAVVGSITTAQAATIFSDGFESGLLSRIVQNLAVWQTPTNTVSVSNERSYSGSYSLKFTYDAVPLGGDDFAEERITLPQKSEYWFNYKLYIPSNYVHRSDGPSNNKFLAVYSNPYGTPGFQVNFTTEPNGSGGSRLVVHYYNMGHEATPFEVVSNFITDPDKGKWMDLIVQVKVPTSASSSDGVMKMWKNGQQVVNVTNLNAWGDTQNYINEAYFLGWSNSGFSETTSLFIDDVQISDTPLSSLVPKAPTMSVR